MAPGGSAGETGKLDDPMDTRRCYRIADRLDAGLQREIGQGIARERMVHEPLYARDVLLVCDALRGTELERDAQKFRAAMAAAEPMPDPERTAVAAGGRSGFSASRFLSSLFGPASGLDSTPASEAPPARRSSWFGRSGNARK
jgi:hypothetical protein